MTAAPGSQQPDEVGYSPLVRAAAEFELDPGVCSAKVSTDEANLGRDLARWVRARDRRGASRHETEWGLAYLLRATRPAAPPQPEDDPCEDGCDPANIVQDTVDSDRCARCGRRGPIDEED